MSYVASFLQSLVSACVTWFNSLFGSTSSFGATAFYLSSIGLVFTIRFLLHPIFGHSAGSDKSGKRKSNNESGDSE